MEVTVVIVVVAIVVVQVAVAVVLAVPVVHNMFYDSYPFIITKGATLHG